jgi:hypothetical protein
MSSHLARIPPPISPVNRTSRSSTLPSQAPLRQKPRHKHRPHASHSHRQGHASYFSRDSHESSSSNAHTSSSLLPLGELLNVRRNVAEGLSGVTNWIERNGDREKDKDKWREWSHEDSFEDPIVNELNKEEIAQAREKRLANER